MVRGPEFRGGPSLGAQAAALAFVGAEAEGAA